MWVRGQGWFRKHRGRQHAQKQRSSSSKNPSLLQHSLSPKADMQAPACSHLRRCGRPQQWPLPLPPLCPRQSHRTAQRFQQPPLRPAPQCRRRSGRCGSPCRHPGRRYGPHWRRHPAGSVSMVRALSSKGQQNTAGVQYKCSAGAHWAGRMFAGSTRQADSRAGRLQRGKEGSAGHLQGLAGGTRQLRGTLGGASHPLACGLRGQPGSKQM